MPEALVLTLKGLRGEVVRGSDPWVIDLTISRALPKEVLSVLMCMATPDTRRTGEQIGLMFPGSGPASPCSDDTQGRVLVILTSLLVVAQVPLDHCHVAATTKPLTIHVLAGFRPVLGHCTFGDRLDELAEVANSSELPP